MLKLVIFDMDGTVFDTNRIIYNSTKLLFKEYKKDLNFSETKKYFGTGAVNYLKKLAEKKGIKENINVLLKKRRNYANNINIKPGIFPGIKGLLMELKKNKIKIALATGSSMHSVKRNMKETKLKIKFDAIMTVDDVKNAKPAPEIFLKIIKKLKTKRQEALVIEDSIAGIEAAKRAGIKVIALTNSFPKSRLKKADLIVDSAEKLSLKVLNNTTTMK